MKRLALIAALGLAIPASFTLQGCGGGETPTQDTVVTNNEPLPSMDGMVEYDMSEAGLSMKMMVPNEDLARALPECSFNEDAGYFELKVGERFWMTIVEDTPDFELKKSDLNEDLLFTNTFIKDEPECLIYESALPVVEEGVEPRSYMRFYMSKEIGGVTYIFEDEKMGEYTRGDIERMVNAINAIAAVTPA